MNGKQGLFPSTYVEKLSRPVSAGNSGVTATAKKPYKPFGAAYQGMDSPPPADQGVNSIGLQQKEGTEAKKDKFGQYKNTVKDFLVCFPAKLYSYYAQIAQSAAGGVGFGAGKLSVYSMNDQNSDLSYCRCRNWRRIGPSYFLDYLLASGISILLPGFLILFFIIIPDSPLNPVVLFFHVGNLTRSVKPGSYMAGNNLATSNNSYSKLAILGGYPTI